MKIRFASVVLLWMGTIVPLAAQTNRVSAAAITVQIPRLIRFNGSIGHEATDLGGLADAVNPNAPGSANDATVAASPHSATVAVVFGLYTQQTGGAPVWQETQNVQPDTAGHYTVLLGSTTTEGMPLGLFTSAKAQWLAIRQQGRPEQPRIMLLSVPYALKAADIETFGGKPPSAYASASETGAGGGAGQDSSTSGSLHPISGGGTTNYVPVWTNSSTLSSSPIYQSMSGTVGIQETNPQAKLQLGNASPGLKGATTQATGTGISGTANLSPGTGAGITGISTSSTGNGVLGNASSTTGNNVGVSGKTGSDGGGHSAAAVFGLNSSTSGAAPAVQGQSKSPSGMGGNFLNSATTGTNTGMGGFSMSDSGIAAEGIGISAAVTVIFGLDLGAAGSSNQDGGVGAEGTTDDAIAVRGRNNSTNSQLPAAYFDNVQNRSEIAPILIARSHEFDGFCELDVSGDINCNGSLSAAVPVDDGSRKVALYAEQSPENWFEDAGSAQLSKGTTVVTLEPIFAQTVNNELEYHVFLTPTGDCNGLYVSNKTATSFEVRELSGGASNITFDYRIVARRKGYEHVRLADETERFNFGKAARSRRPTKEGSDR